MISHKTYLEGKDFPAQVTSFKHTKLKTNEYDEGNH